MGILIITWNFPPRHGGIERVVARLYAGLKSAHSVELITTSGSSTESESGVFRAPLAGLLPFFLYALWRGSRLLFRNRDIKAIFGGSVLVTPIVLLLARLFRRGAVIQAHGLDVIYPSAVYRLFCVRWAKYCDRLIANSRYTAGLLGKQGVPQDRILVIPPGVDPERFASEHSETSAVVLAGEQRKRILFVGRLARRKGVKEFVQKCLPEILRHISTVEFVIAGDNPRDSLTQTDDVAGELFREIAELNLADHVRLVGAVDDEQLVRLYRECDVVVLPVLASKADVEGFGIVLLEAAAAGKAVVATRAGGIPDAMEDGSTGFLVEPGDYPALTAALVELLRDPLLASEMGKRGQCRIMDQFRWSRIIPKYEAAFEAADAKNRMRRGITEAPEFRDHPSRPPS
jgi:phosphatidylinositol alpha-1,6-mannosyltransferase